MISNKGAKMTLRSQTKKYDVDWAILFDFIALNPFFVRLTRINMT